MWYNWVGFDIVGDLVFAESFGCLERQEYHSFVQMIVGTVQGGAVLVVLNYLGLEFILRVIWKMGVRKLVSRLRAQMTERLEKRIETKVEVEDLFEGLMKHRKEWVSVLFSFFSSWILENVGRTMILSVDVGHRDGESDVQCRPLSCRWFRDHGNASGWSNVSLTLEPAGNGKSQT
jgi:hypothetical protein